MGPMAAVQAKPTIAVEGLGPPTGDAPCKGVGGTSRSEWRLGVIHFSVSGWATRWRSTRSKWRGSWGVSKRAVRGK